ncbi:MAG: hypothetical protein ACLGHN_13600 [Bacteriovoracia bacterium]
MGNDSDNSMNVYPQINFMKYYMQLIKKHWPLVLSIGLFLGSIFYALAFIQNFYSSTLLRFRADSGASAPTSLVSPLGGTQVSLRDKNFNYLQAMPFYFELSRQLNDHPEGPEFIRLFLKSKNNLLVKFKKLFVDVSPLETKESTVTQVAVVLKRIMSFKKDQDNGIYLMVRSGTPELSLKLGRILGELTRKIIVKNESMDIEASATHFKNLLSESQTNLMRLNNEMLENEENQQLDHGSGKTQDAMMDTEKELRMAKIEVQRLDLLIKSLERELNQNSTYSIDNNSYKYIDQVGMERLEELKRDRKSAEAKVKSVSRTYEEMKVKNLGLPVAEQIETNLAWELNLERSIQKDLILKSRDLDSQLKSTETIVQVGRDTNLLPSSVRISKPVKFAMGFFLGIILALIGVYYFYEFFKVLRGSKDLIARTDKNILNSIPLLKKPSKKFDLWRELPSNHQAMESFRHLMEFTLEQKVLTFVSSKSGEGKSFIISNLAENLTRFGKKVLIVDTNFVNPTLSRFLPGHPQIEIVVADKFRHGPGALIDRSLLVKEIKTRSKDCDVILIDTQNLHDCNDALIAASVSNMTVVVASYLETYFYRLDEVIRKLQVAEIPSYTFLWNKANINDEIVTTNTRALDDVDANTLYFSKSS